MVTKKPFYLNKLYIDKSPGHCGRAELLKRAEFLGRAHSVL